MAHEVLTSLQSHTNGFSVRKYVQRDILSPGTFSRSHRLVRVAEVVEQCAPL